jgi:transketolase
MLNPKQYLSPKIFKRNIETESTRNGFGQGLVLAGEKDERVVVLTADLGSSTKTNLFKQKFPERFIEVGVAEQALITVASGMANYGKIPFATSFAVFSPGRNWEQIRTTICLNDVPVKIIGSHVGVSFGPDGATHQALEDIALMRTLPNMAVIFPSDSLDAQKATLEIAKNNKPSYLRLTRNDTPVFTTAKTPFKIGRAEILWQSDNPQVAIIACGPLVYEALLAAKELDKKGIETQALNCHTLKPLDEISIIRSAKTCGAVVTVEEHQVTAGLGGAISELLAKNFPTPIEMIGMPDCFGESGEAEELLEKYEMKKDNIIQAVKRVIARKNS